MQMITMTTRPGDIVIDPFAGTSVVPAVAAKLNRYGLGIEINGNYVRAFRSRWLREISQQTRSLLVSKKERGNGMSTAIIQLRILKLPKLLFLQLSRADNLGSKAKKMILGSIVQPLKLVDENNETNVSNIVGAARIQVLCTSDQMTRRLRKGILQCLVIPPLSKFGIKTIVDVIGPRTWKKKRFWNTLSHNVRYIYTNGRFFEFRERFSKGNSKLVLSETYSNDRSKYPWILSSIGRNIQNYD